MIKPLYLFLLISFFLPLKSHAEYMCSSWSSTANNGIIYDSGGAGGDYSYNEVCDFVIEPDPSPSNITLNFSELYIEPYDYGIWDYLEVYDGSSTSGTLLGRFYGYYSPNSVSVTATSGSMYLRFISDSWYIYPGFIASWTSTNTTTEPELIASYNFDDDWVNNNNLSDQTGSYNGLPSGSLARELAAASGNKADTCYAATFSGGEIDITSLPVSTASGAQTSISYWMYWDGTKNVMPLGWNQHTLFFGADSSGTGNTIYFGFNTWGWDVTGISASGLANGWHHVAAVFTNGSVANNKLYIDGVLQSIAYRTGTVTTSNANVQSTLVLGATDASSSWAFSGKIDNLKIYTGAIAQAQVTTDMNENNTCPSSGGGDTPATNFNCVENGADGIAGNLYTKTTAQSFNFDIVALQDSSTIETSFANGTDHTVTVELVNAETAATCNSYPTLSPVVSQNLNITASDAGIKTSTSMSSSTAYSKVKCRVTDASASPSVIGCSTDSFAIRPTEITLSSNLTYDVSTQTPKAKAGENFTLTATTTAGYDGTPSINNSIIQAHPGAIQTGSVSGVFSAANAVTGIATGTTFNYSEVGVLRFTSESVFDDNFTAVDQSGDCTDDFSNTPVADKVGCKFGNMATSAYFGRFTPDHFDVTLNTPVFSPSCSIFTYLDQPIKYTVNPIVTLIAKNSAGVTTQNYTGDYWKINLSSFTPIYTAFNYPLTVLESNAPTETDNGNGTGLLSFANTLSDILKITKGSLTAPVDADIALSFNLIDTDSITVANVNGAAQVNPVTFGTASVGNGISFSGNNKSHRWGRVRLGNTHGSELTPLSVPLYTEYYNGTHFVKNIADNCTAFSTANNFSISDASDLDCSFATQTTPISIGSGSVKASLLNNTLITGESELIISDNSISTKGAGAGNTGYVDITSKLTNLPWLLYDWDGDTVADNCPTARATFGIYKGNEKQIYFREVY